MKILKYAIALFAIVAMTASVSSCSKDVDDRMADKVEAKQNFWIEFSLSNPGSLDAAAQVEFIELFNQVVYNVEKKQDELICNPLYVTEDYDRTNRFYRSMGFREFEVIPELWGPENPCQIYVMAL